MLKLRINDSVMEVRDRNNDQSWSCRGGFTLQVYTVHNNFSNEVLELRRSNVVVSAIEIEIKLNHWSIL